MLKSFYRDEVPPEFEIHDENVASQQFAERLGIANVIKQWRTIVVVVIACVGVAFVYVLIAPRQYKATALVSIDSTGDSVMRTATAPPDFNVQSANVDGQVEVMRSEQLLRRVAAAVSKDGAVTKDSASAALLSLNTSSSWPFGALVPWPASTDDTVSNSDTVQELIKRTSAKRRGLTHIVELTAAMPDRNPPRLSPMPMPGLSLPTRRGGVRKCSPHQPNAASTCRRTRAEGSRCATRCRAVEIHRLPTGGKFRHRAGHAANLGKHGADLSPAA